jgi:hypothetical protein
MAAAEQTEILRRALPYGLWIEPGGGVVAFNRRYRPIVRIGSTAEDGALTRLTGDERITFRQQFWFYKDDNPPWRDKDTRRRCEQVLHSFGLDPAALRAEAAAIRGERRERRWR